MANIPDNEYERLRQRLSTFYNDRLQDIETAKTNHIREGLAKAATRGRRNRLTDANKRDIIRAARTAVQDLENEREGFFQHFPWARWEGVYATLNAVPETDTTSVKGKLAPVYRVFMEDSKFLAFKADVQSRAAALEADMA